MYTVEDIAKSINGIIKGDGTLHLNQLSKIENKVANSLTFFANGKYETHLHGENQRAVIVPKGYKCEPSIADTLIEVEEVYSAWAIVQKLFVKEDNKSASINPLSSISDDASLGKDVDVGQFVVIESSVVIGDNTFIGPQVYLGENVKIGKHVKIGTGAKILHNCIIGDYVVIQANSVVGSDGFGYHFTDGRYHKMPQNGNVIIEDFVEIGANVCIDRASIGSTIIKKGAVLDNLIQIAHSVEVGEHVAIAAQAGISGSSKIGNYVQLGGQAGIAGHVQIAEGSKIQAQSGVSGDIIEKGKKWYGYPVLSYMKYLRSYAIFKSLPDFVLRVQKLEKAINQITSKDRK